MARPRSRPPRPHRVRAAARLVARAAGRLRRVAGHAVTASVTTTDSVANAAAVRPATRRPARPRGTAPGPGLPVMVVAGLMVLIVALLGAERVTGLSLLPDRFIAGLRPPPRGFPVLPASPPTSIAIDRIDVRAPVHHVGIAPDGSIGVPDAARAQEAGWYDQGPAPGQYGPAVIVGHVDTSSGPAVFHGLRNLRDGDEVEVTREDGKVAVFEVDQVQRHGKENLPVDEVYGDFSRPNLRLITCGGRWVGGDTGYADNVVVYASLVRAHDG
ncbi:class F sortase [Micromonospora sp. KC606]|uniref:class F sortase n=1 Tax=Micromonospora sp. KC606 TaxID=2530379 RepID=UPI00104DEC60|nr:class F sortase [Micromonospora sp. KC606]TDC83221.1 class F sortase [Micromonospora sp. KC606]